MSGFRHLLSFLIFIALSSDVLFVSGVKAPPAGGSNPAQEGDNTFGDKESDKVSGQLVYQVPGNMRVQGFGPPDGVHRLIGIHHLETDTFTVYTGSASTCTHIILCSLGDKSPIKTNFTCNPAVTIIPPENTIEIGGTKHMYSGVEITFVKANKGSNDFEVQVFKTVKGLYDDKDTRTKESTKVSVKLDKYIGLMAGSITCPSRIHVSMVGAKENYVGYKTKIGTVADHPYYEGANSKTFDPLKPSLKLKNIPKADFTETKCCTPHGIPEGFVTSQFVSIQSPHATKWTFQVDSNKNYRSVLLEMNPDRQCGWLRLCFHKDNDPQFCNDGKQILDVMLDMGFLIPTDHDQAQPLNVASEKIKQIELRVIKNTKGKNKLVVSYGHGSSKSHRPAHHVMDLNGWDFDANSVIVVGVPEYCSVRLTKHFGGAAISSTIGSNQAVDVDGCSCAIR